MLHRSWCHCASKCSVALRHALRSPGRSNANGEVFKRRRFSRAPDRLLLDTFKPAFAESAANVLVGTDDAARIS
jgi:hypothetical protein